MMAAPEEPLRRRASAGLGPAVAILLSAVAAPAAAQSFPADSEWVPLTRDGAALADPQRDAQDERDIVGDADNPAAYVAGDADFLYFRLRVDSDPLQGGGLRPFGWGVEIDTDGDAAAYELLAMVDGIDNPDQVTLQHNSTPSTKSARDPAETLIAAWPASTHARVVDAPSSFGGDPDFFIDWAIDRADLQSAGFDASEPLRLAFGTSNNAQTLASDLSGTTTGESLVDILSDPVNCEGTSCDACMDLCGADCTRCSGATSACDGQQCVECATGADCAGDTPICDRDTNTCQGGAACGDDADCDDPDLPACQPDGSCGECSAENAGLCSGDTPTCDVDLGRCSGCTDDADCDDPAVPACQPDGSCGECSAENDVRCAGTTPVCDLSVGLCRLPCDDDADCDDPALPICQPDGSCGECSADDIGVCDPDLQACNPEAGRCAEACGVDTDCPAVRPFCREAVVCTECTGDDASACPEERPVCDVEAGLCVEEACQQDTDCDNASLPACLDGRCTQCSADNTARCTGELDQCDGELGICVAGGDARGPDAGADGAGDGGTPGDDSGPTAGDAGAPGSGTGASIEGGGCGCRLAGRERGGAAAGAVALGWIGLLARRRRRR